MLKLKSQMKSDLTLIPSELLLHLRLVLNLFVLSYNAMLTFAPGLV